MKKILAMIMIAALLLGTLSLAGCGKTEMAVTENTGKLITLEAKGASKDIFLVTGNLEVGEGEKIVITSELKKGEIKIEIITVEGIDDINKVPDIDAAAVIMTADIRPGNAASGTMQPGDYMLRATCIEKTTGTVRAEVLPAD